MNNKPFSTSFKVDRAPNQVFAAINDVRAWWSGEIDGRTDARGAEFTYRYKNVHRTTQKITEFVPGKRIVWHVTDSYIGFVQDKSEWDGTEIVFVSTRDGFRELYIQKVNEKTARRLTTQRGQIHTPAWSPALPPAK